jgi:hypothetical protein
MRRALLLALALVLAAPAAARAQQELLPPEDKAADWSAEFERGLDLLREKKLDESIRAFQRCNQLFPDRAVSYYNIACAYSLKKDAPHAVEWLKKSFERGFLDLAHVGRDTDLDNVREDDDFKALVKETRKTVLRNAPEPVIAYPTKEISGKLPLVVWIGNENDDTETRSRAVLPLADALPAIVMIIPGNLKGQDGGKTMHWDTADETVIVHQVNAALKDGTHPVDPERIVLAGQFDGAMRALDLAAGNGWKHVVAGAGVFKTLDPEKAKGMRIFLSVPLGLDERLAAAQEVRDVALGVGAHVKIVRHDARAAFPDEHLETLERSVRWALGEKDSTTPATGEIKKF